MLSPAEFVQLHGDPTEPDGADPTELVFDEPGPRSDGEKPRNFDVYDLTLAAAVVPAVWQTITAPYAPDYWTISNRNTAATHILIWTASGPGGAPIRLGPAGNCRIPGRDVYLTLQNIGTAIATVTVMATRGFDVDLSWGV